jgi:succinyl-CoA:acetate CoA-transferase
MSISTPAATRVLNSKLESKIMTAEEAAGLIRSGDQIGMSGFTGSGYPKAVPIELDIASRMRIFVGRNFK